MDVALLGWPPDAPTLRLDYRRFAYAGKFVLGSTGKAVVADGSRTEATTYDDHLLAAASFSPDRTDADVLSVRYVTVRDDRQGEGLGARLLAFVAARAADRDYGRVRIAVNNPAAYVAAYRAGFAFTGEETGLAELVCERPAARPAAVDPTTYCEGLDRYRARDLPPDSVDRLDRKRAAGPPGVVDPPVGAAAADGATDASEPGG